MGVHDVDKYPEVKRLLGIPEDEPIFIFRGQDELAEDALHLYFMFAKRAGVSEKWLGATRGERPKPGTLEAAIQEFEQWANQNRDKVKLPD